MTEDFLYALDGHAALKRYGGEAMSELMSGASYSCLLFEISIKRFKALVGKWLNAVVRYNEILGIMYSMRL